MYVQPEVVLASKQKVETIGRAHNFKLHQELPSQFWGNNFASRGKIFGFPLNLHSPRHQYNSGCLEWNLGFAFNSRQERRNRGLLRGNNHRSRFQQQWNEIFKNMNELKITWKFWPTTGTSARQVMISVLALFIWKICSLSCQRTLLVPEIPNCRCHSFLLPVPGVKILLVWVVGPSFNSITETATPQERSEMSLRNSLGPDAGYQHNRSFGLHKSWHPKGKMISRKRYLFWLFKLLLVVNQDEAKPHYLSLSSSGAFFQQALSCTRIWELPFLHLCCLWYLSEEPFSLQPHKIPLPERSVTQRVFGSSGHRGSQGLAQLLMVACTKLRRRDRVEVLQVPSWVVICSTWLVLK